MFHLSWAGCREPGESLASEGSLKLLLTPILRCTKLTFMKRLPLAIAFVALAFLLLGHAAAQTAGPSALPAAAEIKLAIAGDVPMPVTLSAADLAAMPRASAEITEQDGAKSIYEGVSLQEILQKAGVSFGRQMRGKALAGYVLAEASDGYAVAFSLGELDPDLGGEKVIVADKRDGKPLFQYQGPVRLVIPADKEGARSVRMLQRLEVVALRK